MSSQSIDQPGEPDFASWAARVAAGEIEAEADVVAYFLPRVKAMMRARLRDADAGGDLAQDALVAVLVALRRGQVRDTGRLASFVAGVARNVVSSHVRVVRRRAEAPLDEQVTELAAAEASREREREEAVARGLAAIAPGDREVLLLTLVEGLSPRDIAQRLAVSPEAIRQRKSRAVRRIVAALQVLAPPAGQRTR